MHWGAREDVELYVFCNFSVIQLDGSDVILEVDWMRLYSPIIFYFVEPNLSSK